jgi:NAD(P)H-flavin reductase
LLLERLELPRLSSTVVLICGPEVMMWYVAQTALAQGLTAQSLWVSLERNMNCAVGLCGHCQLGPEFICKDGPVFRYDRVAAILKVENL